MKHLLAGYGYYPGGDPRNFSPDPESCTAAEVARWKAACAAWERGETPDPGGPHIPIENGHLTVGHYGIGIYDVEWDCEGDPECLHCHPPTEDVQP